MARITLRTVTIAVLPDMNPAHAGGAQAPALLLPADPTRVTTLIVVNALTFLGESAAAVLAFGTTGAFAINTGTATVPLTLRTTGEIWGATYSATGVEVCTLRAIVENNAQIQNQA